MGRLSTSTDVTTGAQRHASPMTTTTPRPIMTVLMADRLFDGTTDSMLPHPRVLVDHGTIRAVQQTDVDLPGAQIIDLTGSTLVPGLIDTHVHLAFDASSDPVGHLAARDDAEALLAMVAAARRAARGGVTTVRDLGDRGYLSLALRDAARSDRTIPDIVAAGPPITTPGGHATTWAPRSAPPTTCVRPCASTWSTAWTSSRSLPAAAISLPAVGPNWPSSTPKYSASPSTKRTGRI